MRKYHLIQYNKPDCCFTGTPRQPRVPACTDSFIVARTTANKLSHLTGDHAQRNVSREMKHTASGLVQASKIMRQNRPPPSPSANVDSTQSGDAENARNAIVWNTECCICLSTAEQECMSRQERAPDIAADCVLVND